MAGIFSDLSSIGFGGLSNVNIFDDEDEKKKSAKQQGATGTPQYNEVDFLFDKKVQCPVCDNEFKIKTVKIGRASCRERV